MITAESFRLATGRKPVGDDLERANCPHRGPAHWGCGWDEGHNLPRDMARMLDTAATPRSDGSVEGVLQTKERVSHKTLLQENFSISESEASDASGLPADES